MGRPLEPFVRLAGPRGSPVELYLGDALGGLPKRVAARTAQVVVTSPPYNLGTAYSHYQDALPRGEYLEWIGAAGRVVTRALAEDGSFFLNLGSPPKDPWLAWDAAREVGRSLALQNVIHWVKSIAIDRSSAGRTSGLERDLAVGHYKPVASDRFLHGAHEYIFHFTHHGDVKLDRLAIGVAYQDKSNVTRWRGAGNDLRCRGNTWFLPYPTIRRRASDRPHPATFPAELAERCLKLHGAARTLLAVDPFLGIGSSAVAAQRLGIPFIGFDVDENYLTIARERLVAEGAKIGSAVAHATSATTERSVENPWVK